MKKATIVVCGSFTDCYKEYFTEYSSIVRQFLARYNGVVVRRQLVTETLYGSTPYDLIMVIDFDNQDVAKRIFFEDEYVKIIPLRDKVFRSFNMYLADFGEV